MSERICRSDISLCFPKRTNVLREDWICIHGFPSVKDADDFLSHHKEDITTPTQLLVMRKCYPKPLKHILAKRRLTPKVQVTDMHYRDLDDDE